MSNWSFRDFDGHSKEFISTKKENQKSRRIKLKQLESLKISKNKQKNIFSTRTENKKLVIENGGDFQEGTKDFAKISFVT